MIETINETVLFRIRHGRGNWESECIKRCLEGILRNADACATNTRISGFESLVPYSMKASPGPSQFMITALCQDVKLKEA